MNEPVKLKVGDRQGVYRVVAVNHLGPLPQARIESGPNTGVLVVLTSPWKA